MVTTVIVGCGTRRILFLILVGNLYLNTPIKVTNAYYFRIFVPHLRTSFEDYVFTHQLRRYAIAP